MSKTTYFGPELFKFLKELKQNNRREWFHKNKDRYEQHVKEPLLGFIADFGVELRKISKYYISDPRPSGGSMFRIYRDIRFARDKSPYKTQASAHFNHKNASRDVHTPGFYLHLEPGNCMGGGGLWHPDSKALKLVRDQIANKPNKWKGVLDAGIKIEGDKLIRPPRGYDENHEYIDYLKQKDFYAMVKFSEKDAISANFMEHYIKICRKVAPLDKFLTDAIGLSW